MLFRRSFIVLLSLVDGEPYSSAGRVAALEFRRPLVAVEVRQAQRQLVFLQLVDADPPLVDLRAGGVDDLDLLGVLRGIDQEPRSRPLARGREELNAVVLKEAAVAAIVGQPLALEALHFP